MEALLATLATPLGATDTSRQEGASSLVVLKTGRDRVYSIDCPVCGVGVKLGVPVVCEFIGTWNQTLRGGREAALKGRQHCEDTHPDEYVWWAIPRGRDATNESSSARMDELMRYVLKRTVEKVGIESLTTLCSNEKWSLDRKALALSLFIY